MNRGRLIAATAVITIPALGLAVGALTSAARAASRAPASAGHLFSKRIVAVNCQGRAQVRPSTFTLACADANDSLARLSWASWSPGMASATGVQEENDCVPDCASGHFRGYPVDVVFWGTGTVPGQPGSQRYTEVTLLYPGARPARQGATFSVPLP
jgi:hypothetical protein